METKSQLKELQLKNIVVGTTNPRKTFDEVSLNELAISIQEKGVLQPILVRTTKKKNVYELVCGERRFRASKIAKLKHIPANIRELSDDEAFEMQIIENLERKDVHPLEEAEAFKRMLDSKKYTVADIAAKMAKPESFIVQRLKLVEIIEPIKQDFFQEKLGIGHAIHIARLPEEKQQNIYESANSKFGISGYGTVQQLKLNIQNAAMEIANAVFNIEDEKIIPAAGSCVNCPKRSGANPALFPDFQEVDSCFDAACFHKKTQIHVEREIAAIVEEGKNIHLLSDSDYGEAGEYPKRISKEFKVPVLKWHEEYMTYGKGKTSKGFYVNGNRAGKTENVYIVNKKKSDSKVDPVKEQIQRIEERAERALELDREKVTKGIHEKIISPGEHRLFNPDNITNSKIEMAAVATVIYEGVYGANQEWFQKTFDFEGGYTYSHGLERFNAIIDKITPETFSEALRRYLLHQLVSNQELDREKHGKAEALYHLTSYYHPSDLKAIEQEQNDAAEKRIARTNKKLEELKKQLKS